MVVLGGGWLVCVMFGGLVVVVGDGIEGVFGWGLCG